MQIDNWQKKNLGAVLGSYTELKHDTLLYAKQSYAELGGGRPDGEIPPVPKGYVEPDITFWNRIINLAEMTNSGLTKRGLMPEVFQGRFEEFVETSKFFRDLSIKELENKKISDEEFERLRTISADFNLFTAPIDGEVLSKKDMRAGIIADIHTDAWKGEILYEATGKPHIIYVAVSDANGTRLTRGVVYNHYELKSPLGKRLTDEDWHDKVYEGKGDLPAGDPWTEALIK